MVLVVKNLPGNAGDIRDPGSIFGSGRSPGEGNGNLLQYSCWTIAWMEEPGRLQSIRVTKSWTQLKKPSIHTWRISKQCIFPHMAEQIRRHKGTPTR